MALKKRKKDLEKLLEETDELLAEQKERDKEYDRRQSKA